LGRIRIFATGVYALTKRAHCLKTAALTCLLVAWPLCASAQATEKSQSGLSISKTTPDSGNDPLQIWFKEQDRLLDDILLRLARIETLVRDLHRLISQLPNAVQPTAPLPSAPSLPVAPSANLPIPASVTAPSETGSSLIDWAPQLAGGGLLLALLLWWSRRRSAEAKPGSTARPRAVPPAPTILPPERSPAPAPARVAPPPVPAAPAGVSIQAAGKPNIQGAQSAQGDQALELAEIMLSMGLGRGAAQTLAEQIRHEPKQALRQWLKLLEIYRQNGQQDEFERSAEEMRQHFNVQPEDWQTRPEAYRSIADYPHIAARLSELWGKPSCLNYLGNLLDDNRGGARAGFPQTVAEELLLLTAMLRAEGLVAEVDAAGDAA
jgi:hypothetical protein